MEEAFLHFVWRFQYFNSKNLTSHDGQRILILNPGTTNNDAGPDFKNCKIRIGSITWNGNVEIHIEARDWIRHHHQNDPAYDNVILHVVWKNDIPVKRRDLTIIPTLELKGRIEEELLLNYRQLMQPKIDIFCKPFLPRINSLLVLNMREKALVQRLEKKASLIFRELGMVNGDWEEVTWRVLCKNFGFNTNAFPFKELGKSLSFKILKKESHQLVTIEALLFGMAGLLQSEIDDSYFKRLKKEHHFKMKKYKLERRLDEHQWKFLRLRPANFPTIRLAQLASLVAMKKNIFYLFTDFNDPKELKNNLILNQSEYWKTHYRFGVKSKSKIGQLGISSIENIIINTVSPLRFTYGIHKDSEELKDKSMALLQSIGKESNSIIKKWSDLGVEVSTAFDSQAFLELYNEYCLKKRCLNCAIGVDIVNSGR